MNGPQPDAEDDAEVATKESPQVATELMLSEIAASIPSEAPADVSRLIVESVENPDSELYRSHLESYAEQLFYVEVAVRPPRI